MITKIDPEWWLSKFSTYPLHTQFNPRLKKSLKKIFSSCKSYSIPLRFHARLRQHETKNSTHTKIKRLSKKFFHLPTFLVDRQQAILPVKNKREELVTIFTTIREHAMKYFEEQAVIQLIAFLDDFSDLHEHASIASLCSQILVLIEHSPEKIPILIQHHCKNELEKNIDHLLKVKLSDHYKKFEKDCIKFSKSKLVSPHTISEMLLGIELANLLITTKGYFNSNLIPKLLKKYFLSENTLFNFSTNFKNNLQFLYQSSTLRSLVNHLRLPKELTSETAFLIRASLKLSKDEALTDVHYKKCILSAFLTHLRQSESGSCFATFVAIQQKAVDPEQVLLDLDQLLSKRCLTREVDQREVKFPCLLKWNDLITKKPLKYEEDPFLLKTLKFLGIRDRKKKLKSFLNQATTIEKILSSFSLNETEVELGKLYYASIACHPLLRIWENSLAGMSEGPKEGLLKNALVKSIQFILNSTLQKKITQYHLEEPIKCFLEQNIHYLYDPNYSNEHVKTRGAFILYFKNERLDNVDKFRNFLHQMIDKLSFSYPKILPKDIQERILQTLGQRKTMAKLLKHYHRENSMIAAAKGAYQLLRYTPWITMMGNDPQTVLKVYHQQDLQYETFPLTPKDAADLFKQLLYLLRRLPQTLRIFYQSHSVILTPLIIQGVHSCSFMPSHRNIKPFLNKNPPTKEFVEKMSLEEKKISNAPLTYLMRHRLIERILEELVDKELQVSFYAKTGHFPDHLTLKEFRRLLLKQPKDLSDRLTLKQQQQKLDQMIMEELPDKLRSPWEKSLIHFADSNWGKGIHDIHYAFGINPFSEEFELMTALDNDEFHEFQDQNLFFKNQRWEFGF